eukprot:scaffold546867_cov18-Prasinocladus_malaysianus.AAC.1
MTAIFSNGRLHVLSINYEYSYDDSLDSENQTARTRTCGPQPHELIDRQGGAAQLSLNLSHDTSVRVPTCVAYRYE